MGIEERIQEIGGKLLAEAKRHIPSLVSRDGRHEALFDLCMNNPAAATHIFRFLDVFPSLPEPLIFPHVQEYLIDSGVELGVLAPVVMAAQAANAVAPQRAAQIFRDFAEEMALTFIAGRTLEEAIERVGDVPATFDLLGELTTSGADAMAYARAYHTALATFARRYGTHAVDSFGSPRTNLSIKLSAMDPCFSPVDPEGTFRRVREQLLSIFDLARGTGAFINLDAEHLQYRDLTTDIFERVVAEGDFDHVGTVVQVYLRDSERVLDDLITFAKERGKPITVRLVKGAYWDHEVKVAVQNGWPVPVFTRKPETDAQYERLARKIFENRRYVRGAFATHSLRSAAAVVAMAEHYHMDQGEWELQGLFGVGKPVVRALRQLDLPRLGKITVREYVPTVLDGNLLPGMGYFVRRLLENSANGAFVRSLKPDADPAVLLCDPRVVDIAAEASPAQRGRFLGRIFGGFSPRKRGVGKAAVHVERDLAFRNYPVTNFALPETRAAVNDALSALEHRAGRFEYGVYVNGKWRADTGAFHESCNPSQRSQVLGKVAVGSARDVDAAVTTAANAFPSWRDTSVEERAALLDRVAGMLAARRHDFAAMLTYEAGKPRVEASGEVDEAIDFHRFYAATMRRLAGERPTQHIPGERDTIRYAPLGVFSVIGPFNFPLAILGGMTAAPLVTGNTVVMKPAPDTPLIGGELMKAYEEAGVPAGVLNYVFCEDHDASRLVEAPDVNGVVFTGSEGVGKRISEAAGAVGLGQRHFKRCIIETGGKNAIVVSESADLEQAVLGVVRSAFGYAGQKCSAASRVIVVDSVYDRFVAKLVAAAESLHVGDARLPDTDVPPLINEKAFRKVEGSVADGEKQGGKVLLRGTFEARNGFYVSPVVMEITPQNVLAREEVFGPVLGVMRAGTFEEVIGIANMTRFSLTGGVYSRTPSHIEFAKRHFNVGNLYINRGITGAIVQRHPFGGYQMSGAGSKAGGAHYLLHFMREMACAEDMSRSGHIPGIEEFAKKG